MKQLKVIIIGCGDRGTTYARHMHTISEKYKVVGVAEPIDDRRNFVRDLFDIPEEMCFTDWHPLTELGKIADVAVVATMDRDHFAPAMKAIELGYDLLLEKPIAPTQEECKLITEAATKKGVKVVICTVLRYTPVFLTLKKLLDDGKIGDVVSINHEECVGIIHQSHSFVRGNWGNIARSSEMLLQKSCHDIDIIQWLLQKECKKVQSFGSLTYFKRENAPEGSPERCIDGCPHGDTCPFNAVKLYYDDKGNGWFRGACTKRWNHTDELVEKSLRETQYGKCVYKCDNDVVDHQTVNMLFDGNVTVTFTMNAFNRGGRFMHIMGTKGEIRCALDSGSPIELFNFQKNDYETYDITGDNSITGGHGGGDSGLVYTLYNYLTDGYSGSSIPEISESYYNHSIVFAAEKARLESTVVDFDEYMKDWKNV